MSQNLLPPLPEGFEYRLDLRHHVTPRLLQEQPVHRWFWFPHSFSPQLVDEILKAYPLPPHGSILDPFVGAGATVRRAYELGYHAAGTDLSPLSVFVSQVKLARFDRTFLHQQLRCVLEYLPLSDVPPAPERLAKAFTAYELAHLLGLQQTIATLPKAAADFFRLVLLRVQQRVSRAAPDGGWFRWVEKEDQSKEIRRWFEQQSHLHMEDVAPHEGRPAQVFLDDARRLEQVSGRFDLVITSPPYPNRHDYSRIFHIELLTLGLHEEDITQLRRASVRSHVEAKQPEVRARDYRAPDSLQAVLRCLPETTDPRIAPMLQGYFADMHLTFEALASHLSPGAVCAFVVGNVRHAGVMAPVDQILIDVAGQAGFTHERTWVARLRGNSAQQMGRFGREPARESVVFLRKG
jgi:hypothetical protein